MEISAARVSNAVSPFSDQSHLQFYGHGSSSFTPSKLSFNMPPRRSFPSFASKPVILPLRALSDDASANLTAEQALMKEIADLKLQMKQKKKELKSRIKGDKEKLKMQLKEGKKMKKQNDVQEGKTKMKCQSESSSSSESSDEECVSVSMKMLRRQGHSMLENARVNSEGGLGAASSVCASDTIEVCDGFSSNVVSLCNDVMDGCASRVSPLGRDNAQIYSSMGCTSIQKVISGLEEVQKHGNTCGMMSPLKSMSDSQLGFTLNALPSLHASNGIEHASNRIEVCAGGKCKKGGSEQLLLALRGQIPGSSNVEVVPCKCMGKCSLALNVRVHKEDANPQHHSNVGVEDVSLILGHHFGLGCPSVGLPSLAPKDRIRAAPLPLVIA